MNQKPAFQPVPRIEKPPVRVGGSMRGERSEVDVGVEDEELRRKLLEKLGFLEKKVAIIGIEIKQVKEMLNVDMAFLSKFRLLEIEKRILGIERQMGFVGSDSVKDVEFGSYGDGRTDVVGRGDGYSVNLEKAKVTDEAHQRLLKERKLKDDEKGNETFKGIVVEHNLGSGVSEKQLSLQSVVVEKEGSMTSDQVGMEICGGQGGDVTKLQDRSTGFDGKHLADIDLTSSETLLDENASQGNDQTMVIDDDINDSRINSLHQIGIKAATGGWFVSDGELALLAHDDGCCSLYDLANCDEKTEYKPPVRVPTGIWRDCWLLRVPGIDGCLGKYVVAASAGNTTNSGFCAWEFHSQTVQSFHIEDKLPPSRTHLNPSTSSRQHRRHVLPAIPPPITAKWWYKPCGPLMISTASSQQTVKVFDLRDGEQIMKFEAQKPVSTMEYCSPLQWRNEGKVVLAESDKVSLWDVNSLSPKPLFSAHTSNQKITALQVGNIDGEMSKGVRKRVSKSVFIGDDGVFCTADFITVLDSRRPSGVALKIPISGFDAKSVFFHGDTIIVGGSRQQSTGKTVSQVQQLCLRKQRAITTYPMPESSGQSNCDDVTQVWGDSNVVLAVSSLGLSVYNASQDTKNQFRVGDYTQKGVVIGASDMDAPSFDYALSRILLISRDRPAVWRHLI